MCGLQNVKIHLVELVVELLPKLPGKVVVAERAEQIHGERMKNGGVITPVLTITSLVAVNLLDSQHQESARKTEKVPVLHALD